jgi:O-antigen ligase
MLYFYYLSLIFLNIPFIKFPLISSDLFNTSFVSRILSLVVLTSIILNKEKRNRLCKDIKEKKISIYILLILVAFTLSIIPTINVVSYLSKIESIFFAICIYANSLFYHDKLKANIGKLIYFWLIINILNESILFINSSFYAQYISSFIYGEQTNFAINSSLRQRLLLSSYNELFIPFILFQATLSTTNIFMSTIFLALIIYFALISGWRIRFLSVLLAFLMVSIIKKFRITKKITVVYGLVLALIFLFFIFRIPFSSVNTSLDRLLLDEDSISSNTTRTSLIKESYDIFLSHPLLGTGINNSTDYRKYDYVNPFDKQAYRDSNLFIQAGSHSFFIDVVIETGITGILFIILFLTQCLKKDISLFKEHKHLTAEMTYVLAFWLLVFFSLFHSIQGYRFYSILFLLRVVV